MGPVLEQDTTGFSHLLISYILGFCIQQVGEISERVIVTEAAPLVQSETSSVGQVVDRQPEGRRASTERASV